MRITLSVLLALLTIYCRSTVLSLPPSLIASSASLRQPRLKAALAKLQAENDAAASIPYELHEAWKKDAKFSSGRNADNAFDDIAGNRNHNNNNNNKQYKPAGMGNEATAATVAAPSRNGNAASREAQQRTADLNRKLAAQYDLNALLDAAVAEEVAMQQKQQQPQRLGRQQERARMRPRGHLRELIAPPGMGPMQMSEFFTPLKYWARLCQPGSSSNCPPEYYRALLANSNSNGRQRALKPMPAQTSIVGQQPVVNAAANDDVVNATRDDVVDADATAAVAIDNNNDDDDDRNDVVMAANDDDNARDDTVDNDILMLLNGEQDVMKFLSWAMEQLYPYQRFANISNSNGHAEYYHPGMYIWKKLNLSGRLEPPLIVEEPHYVIVRREQLEEDLQSGSKYKDDPFIPPRGRKHNMPDLDALLNRYETFVPNRGRRDKIKDIFKYDDLFFPNRGKRQKPPKATILATFTRDCEPDNPAADDDDDDLADLADTTNLEDSSNFADIDDEHLVGPPFKVGIRRSLGKLGKRPRPYKRCLPDLVASKAAAADVSQDNSEPHNNDNGWSATLGNIPWHKLNNENDQSVKTLAVPTLEDMTAAVGNMNTIGGMPNVPISALQQQEQLENQWHTAYMNTRLRRVATSGSFASAARVAANRLHSMSTMAQQRQQQRQHQLHQFHQRQQQQYQQQYRRQQQPMPQQAQYRRPQRREELLAQQQEEAAVGAGNKPNAPHHLKSFSDLDLLLWRQLPKPVTWRHPQLSAMPQQQHQHEQQPLLATEPEALPQPRVMPPGTQLANAAAGSDDIDYLYVNI